MRRINSNSHHDPGEDRFYGRQRDFFGRNKPIVPSRQEKKGQQKLEKNSQSESQGQADYSDVLKLIKAKQIL